MNPLDGFEVIVVGFFIGLPAFGFICTAVVFVVEAYSKKCRCNCVKRGNK